MTFILDDRLAGDTSEICNFDLSYVGLLRDTRYPWLVIVPRKPDLVEVADLSAQDRAGLWREVDQCSAVLLSLYPDAKINIGALGNIVRQLHIHVIARHEDDAAWPGPVWGVGKTVAYGEAELTDILARLREEFLPCN